MSGMHRLDTEQTLMAAQRLETGRSIARPVGSAVSVKKSQNFQSQLSMLKISGILLKMIFLFQYVNSRISF